MPCLVGSAELALNAASLNVWSIYFGATALATARPAFQLQPGYVIPQNVPVIDRELLWPLGFQFEFIYLAIALQLV